jgi:NAD(P)-dependent dehydrogenase (short-subunit alcohol dehydrogenase family)
MADLSKEDEVSKLIDQTIKELGKLDVLVNSAAVLITDSIKDSNISQKCDIIFSNNVRPIIQLIHLSIPYLEKTKGTVISISSLAAIFPVFTFLLIFFDIDSIMIIKTIKIYFKHIILKKKIHNLFAQFVKEMCYGMAKASLDIMTKVLAVELGSTGIRVNSIK